VISILSGTTGNPITSAASGSLVFVRVDVTGNSGNGIPTGSVTLTDADASDGATLGLNSFGFAELQTKALPSGSHSFTATYSGDPSFNTSTAAAATLTITGGSGGGGAFSVSASPTSMSVAPGATASSTLTVTGTGGFTGSVALTASVAGPAGAIDVPGCSAAPASISLSSTTTSGTSALSCTTTAKSLVIYVPSRGPNPPIWLGVGATLAVLCAFLLSL